MKRILIFSLTYHPFIGGAEVAIKEITDRQDSEDLEFDMITLRFNNKLPKFEHIGMVNVHRIGFSTTNPSISDLSSWPLKINKYLFPFLGLFKALSLNKTRRYDALWNMMANYSAFAGLFFKLIKPRVKYLLTLQEGDPIDHIRGRVGFFYPLFKKLFTKADFIQVISTHLGNWARDEGYKGPLVVIPNAVDVRKFSRKYGESELLELEKKLNKKDGDIFLITTSRLVKKNACDDVIKSLKLLPANIKFIVLGIGPDELMLRKLTQDTGIEERVIFLGQIAQDEIPKYLQVSDIFIRPSLSEGFGNSFVEAMAASLPVIATAVGGIVDFLKDSETGLICEVRNPESIAKQVKRLIDNPELRASLVSNAQKMVEKRYDWDIVAKDMQEKVFDTI
ncbi:MAG: hypothetical protein COV96_01735 [Candidatus Zambryskibacteria bacterium CG11_big_fil_rev_8_21_14_0_20_42_18]|uniref:Glycosyl transferase family 1 domain-containing protein n=1 Tax=Candidatus Zambryskibacteria bacterium CG_4_9_14_3_um_filter_42_15 TaxID=1975112 RepID=A0A2M7WTH1_9BACT|nr:MAG: hypothetical protein COV96_01735 [Candidatus Zambryskibacteria bacterium CG11_big_fil_rev_8_21_14_0_20_42_18]PJA33223.1 MAG: hypothetical protein CO185_00100 [Candidatus Zambryskibacteria bacterium CG_4_9_14_3_um_filter_42_15]